MDFAGPYITSDAGNRYVLVFVDHFAKWVELVPTGDQLALTVMQAFYARVICRHGCPEYLLSDRGPQFHGALIQAMCDHFGIRKIFSSAYYPQGDGFAERFMRTLNNSLAALCQVDYHLWDTFLPGLQFAYNTSAHSATAVSPFYLNTGRVPLLPGGAPIPDTSTLSHADYLKRLRKVIDQERQRARVMIQKYWDRVKRQYDKQRRTIDLKVGDLVLVRLSDYERAKYPCRKLAPRWSDVAEVVKCLTNGVTYEVRRGDEPPEAVHVSRLLPLKSDVWAVTPPVLTEVTTPTPPPVCDDDDESPAGTVLLPGRATTGPASCSSGTSPPSSPPQAPPSPTPGTTVSSKFYRVERITGARNNRHRGRAVRVEWVGYPPEEATWEPEEQVRYLCSELVDDYIRQRATRGRATL